MCLARNYTTHWHTRPEMIWFRPSVGETCPCTSVQNGATETVSTYLNAFVCSAVFGSVCQCKISAKYGCSMTTALMVWLNWTQNRHNTANQHLSGHTSQTRVATFNPLALELDLYSLAHHLCKNVNILWAKKGNIRKYKTVCGGIKEDGERKNIKKN
jgi:hypothetical protein